LKFIDNSNSQETGNDKEDKILDRDVEDLKQCFAKLRTKVTYNEKNEERKPNYVEMLNQLKMDMMNSRYYNSALDFKKNDTPNNKITQVSQPSNDFVRAKPKTNNANHTLELNSQHFEINNAKSSNSKVQLLEHAKHDEVFKLSFTIAEKENKPVVSKKEPESSSETISSKQPQPTNKPQDNLQQQYNDYMRDYNNYMSMGNTTDQNPNKFNKSNNNQYQNMYNNPSYFYNSDMKSSQEGFGMDPQQMYNNPYYGQNSFYGMPFGYYPYSYGMPDRNMFANMSGNVDPTMMMNMFTNYFMNFQQQQPNFYQNTPSDPNAYQYQNNVNYKK